MERIIIENRTQIPIDEIMLYVRKVIEGGRVSEDGKSYCFITTFRDGIVVSVRRNKNSDRFVVFSDK